MSFPLGEPGEPGRLFARTVGELRVAELQVFARPRRVVLRAHGVLHALDVLLEVVERAEDVLHALAVVQEGGVGLHVAGALGLLGRLDGQRLDDFARGTLRDRRGGQALSEFHTQGLSAFSHRLGALCYSREVLEVQSSRCLLWDRLDPRAETRDGETWRATSDGGNVTGGEQEQYSQMNL